MKPRQLLLIALLATPRLTVADMTLSIRPSGDDLQFRLHGSIDTSVFTSGPLDIGGSPSSSFTHGRFTVAGTGGLAGTSIISRISSAIPRVDYYLFAGDSSLSPFGTVPLVVGSQGFSAIPPFWFGYRDVTITAGPTNTTRDSVYLPDGYVSGSFIDLQFTQRNAALSRYYLQQGDYWGVRFAKGSGGQQAITFQVIPEPAAAFLLAPAALAALSRRR